MNTNTYIIQFKSGTPEERGLTKWRSQFENSENSSSDCKQNCYDLPFVMEFLRKQSWAKYIPFLPTYQGSNVSKYK